MFFGSGMSAAVALFLEPRRRARMWSPRPSCTGRCATGSPSDAAGFGLAVDFVDTEDFAALERAVKPGVTKLVWLETPSNPLWGISDIAESASSPMRRARSSRSNSTCATPIFTRPLELGADVVMHSATKYLNGHSDVIAGALGFARADALVRARPRSSARRTG